MFTNKEKIKRRRDIVIRRSILNFCLFLKNSTIKRKATNVTAKGKTRTIISAKDSEKNPVKADKTYLIKALTVTA